MTKRLAANDYRRLAESRGYIWLGEEVPRSNRTKTCWQCPQGHKWMASYTTVQHGSLCRECSYKQRGAKRRITSGQIAELAQRRGFEWIGATHPYALEYTQWRCGNGHTWSAPYNEIRRGNGCPRCAGNAPLTGADYTDIARKRGLVWLGPLPETNHHLTFWQCQHGHTWEASYSNITSRNSGCPRCKYESLGAKLRNKPDKYHALADQRGFRWVGAEVPNTNTKTTWECPSGHRWDSTFGNILIGNGCPHCLDYVNGARISKPQQLLHKQVGGELNYPVKRYRIDIAFPDEKIALEYDCHYWHNAEYDAKRDSVLRSLGWKILRIKSGALLPTFEELQAALDRLRGGEQQVEIALTDWRQP